LLLFDSGDRRSDIGINAPTKTQCQTWIDKEVFGHPTIGQLRNLAIEECSEVFKPDIIIHFDDDDWSHQNRIAEQVALLQATGADCVGYNEMLFWRESVQDRVKALVTDKGGWTREDLAKYGVLWPPPAGWLSNLPTGEAWLYSNPNPRYALGTSLCYWRLAWEVLPFPDLQHGEDTEWLKGVNCHSVSGCGEFSPVSIDLPMSHPSAWPDFRMIARIHAGNSSSAYDPAEMALHNTLLPAEQQWSRVPDWDKVCREVMER
jgi:hypothetical protein